MSVQKEDVYETDDLPEQDQHLAESQQERFDSDQIERIHVDVNDAFNKFKGKVLSADDADFSDSVAKRRRAGYGGGAYVLELIGGDYSDRLENPEQKFNRLRCEIEELSENLIAIQNEGSSGSSHIGKEDILGLQQQLKSMQIEQILSKRSDISVVDTQAALAQKLVANIDRLKTEKPKEKEAKSSKEVLVAYNLTHEGIEADQKLVSLEGRIRRLESCLQGSASEGDAAMSVAERLEQLEQTVQLQDPAYLEGIEARLNSILQKYNKIQDKKAKKETGDECSEEAKKIEETYEMMLKWNGQMNAVPTLAERLVSLQTLHEQAMQFSQNVTQLEGGQQQLAKLLDANAKLLDEAKSGMAATLEDLKKTCEQMENRLKMLKS